MTMTSPEAVNPRKRSFEAMHSEPDLMDTDEASSFKPRKYQMKAFEVAMRQNTIVVLETGGGKTMIAVLLINGMAPLIKLSPSRRVIVYLAPTVPLVHQQYGYIKPLTSLEVEEYFGGKGVDDWDVKRWEKEVNEHDLLVMTPQVLLDALRKGYLNMDMVCLMIFDECHHATGNHPYSKIMKEFYDKSPSKPKIFGMTASPVKKKGVSSTVDSEKQISDLESLLNSKVYTTEDRTELEEVIPSAKEICRFYDPAPSFNSNLKEKLESISEKCHTLLRELKESMPGQYKDLEDKFKELRKRLSGDHARILYCLDNLGLICAYEAAKICRENAATVTEEECELYRKSYLQCEFYLDEVLSILKASLPDGALDTAHDCSKFVVMGYISPKLVELINIFLSFGEPTQVLCLIFVERIIAAKVIERFVKKVSNLSHFTVSYITGADSLAPKLQKETLESFSTGKVNLLFATDVVEEGIDVPNCSSVIRFDLPKTVRSYIQSRGRARQSEPQFIMMIERGNIKQRDQVFGLIQSEYSMITTALNRDLDAAILRESTVTDIDSYVVDTTGASVTADASVNLIHQYCVKLPRDKYFSPKPDFQFLSSEGMHQCQLTLPASAAFQTLVGPPKRNSNLAKQHVCFEACKKLHQMGALNDHLVPFTKDPSQIVSASETKGSASGAGTTKRKELHGTTSINALSGTWGNKQDGGATFHAYGMHFSCSNPGELYSSFVLLIETKLDYDVGKAEMDLFLVSKSVKTSVSSYGEIHLDAEQINRGKRFQEFFFNGLFGKLFTRLPSSQKGRRFLLQTDEEWDSSYMYLLLPLEKSDTPSCESWNINWLGVNSTVSTVNFLKKHAWLSAEQSSTLPCLYSTERNCSNTSVIHLANKSVETNDLEEMVVMAIHTGRMYSILKFLPDTSAASPFDGNLDGNPCSFLSFADYFNKKYGIVLNHPGQPLLLLKQSHNAHNLLVDFKKEATASKLEAAKGQPGGNHVHMPPELLVTVDNVPIGLLKAFYLLPSVMQRLESLMLASQLRKEITCVSSNFSISSSAILEAITTLRCNECFSMERLELLGDSVLKYAVSCNLFLRYPKKHEGQLSSLRSWAVCNSTLHKVGIDHNLQGYIRDGAFDPRRWLAPGQRTIRPYPCSCGVDTLQVPVNGEFHTEDPKIVVGICCDRGHRWMGSKTISDCVEALIGAYYVDGGLVAALQLMKWLGIDADLDLSLVDEAIRSASLHCYAPKFEEIKTVESKVGYEFSVKGLLLEAITHATEQEPGLGYSYQRLEFLGDSVLDILITRYLYQTHSDIDPGELTDLRSASVNNESFAHAAVKRSLHPHLQHCSALLLNQITEYVKSVSCSDDMVLQGPKVPKALGDMVESIAGAILIDTKLNLEEVWRIFEPLLSPIVSPDSLILPPLRSLIEFSDREGYFIKDACFRQGDLIHAELRLQLKDDLMVAWGVGHNSKVAKGRAAVHILDELEKKGLVSSSRKRQGPDAITQINSDRAKPAAQKKQKTATNKMQCCLDSKGTSMISSDSNSVPVIGPINMKKGGPRTSLLELCKRLQWPAPEYSTTENKSRSPIEFCDGPEMRTGFNSFVSEIKLTIPNSGVESATGDARADKKSSYDSAAVTMLHKLEGQGKLRISEL